MPQVLLISPDEFKEATPVHGNLDEKLIRQSILACQDIFVQNIIGTGIYLEIKTQVSASTLTNLNTILLNDYLQPAMRYWIMAEIIRPISLRYMNVGVEQKRTEVSNPISEKTIAETENHYRNRAEWYAEQCTKYLCENSDDYPLFLNPGDGVDTIVPNQNNYTTAIFLGGVRGKKNTNLLTYDEPFRRSKKY